MAQCRLRTGFAVAIVVLISEASARAHRRAPRPHRLLRLRRLLARRVLLQAHQGVLQHVVRRLPAQVGEGVHARRQHALLANLAV